MSVNRYMQELDTVTGMSRHASRVAGIFGDGPSSPVPQDWRKTLAEARAAAPRDVEGGYGRAAVGAAAGAYFCKKHRVLGALGGFSVARNVPALLGGDRRYALCNLATVGAAVLASLYYPKHPAAAFLVGGAAAGVAISVAGWRK